MSVRPDSPSPTPTLAGSSTSPKAATPDLMSSQNAIPLGTGVDGALTGAGAAVAPDAMSEKHLHPSATANQGDADHSHLNGADHPLAKLGSGRKHFLLFIFSIASFLDICNVSGVAVAVAQISVDIDLGASQIVWLITSYSLCFAALLLFGGRLSDLFPAHIVFEAGFIGLGIMSLITSFVTNNKYGFLILRGIAGCFGAMTIPSSYHLLVHMFPDPKEQAAKLGLLGMAGALGNVLGLVLAGLTMLASYHWFFRLVAILALAFSACAVFLLPWVPPSPTPAGVPKWRLLDIPGVVLMMGALICFILSLTQGPIDGWKAASFIAPMIISVFLAVAFFVWEAKIPARTAVLPSSVWQIINIVSGSLAIMIGLSFWSTSQLQYSTWFQFVFGWSPIHVAAAILPQGIMAMIIGIAAQFFPAIITKPRFFIPLGGLMIIVAEILQIYSYGGAGMDYWRYCFPAFLLGSAGAVFTFFGSAINIVTYSPPEMSGVIGAWTQVVAQVGAAIILAVQAGFEGSGSSAGHGQNLNALGAAAGGLDKIVPAQTLRDQWWNTAARTYWFQIAWTAILCIQYVAAYKAPGTAEEEHERTRKRIAESGKDAGVPVLPA